MLEPRHAFTVRSGGKPGCDEVTVDVAGRGAVVERLYYVRAGCASRLRAVSAIGGDRSVLEAQTQLMSGAVVT